MVVKRFLPSRKPFFFVPLPVPFPGFTVFVGFYHHQMFPEHDITRVWYEGEVGSDSTWFDVAAECAFVLVGQPDGVEVIGNEQRRPTAYRFPA